MLAVGLQGSPRKGGNNSHTLSLFLSHLKEKGFQTETLHLSQMDFSFCIGCGSCEKTGWCILKDEFASVIAPMLRRAEIVVLASPVYFYGPSAQLKAMMDRGQMFWSRKYRLKLSDPLKKRRRGYVLSSAATSGQDLFSAIILNSRYFFDAIDAAYSGALTFREAEAKGALAARSDTQPRVASAADVVAGPLLPVKHRILFVCSDGAIKSRMAWAAASAITPGTFQFGHAGLAPQETFKTKCDAWMEKKKTDIRYAPVLSLKETLETTSPDIIVDMDGCLSKTPEVKPHITWDLPPTPPESDEEAISLMRAVESRVKKLLGTLNSNASS